MSTLGPLGAQRSRRTPWWLSGGMSVANCIAAYQPKGAASLAASYANLANPGTYDATPGVAPTWDAVNGWIFNGATQYLTTGFPIGATSWSAFIRFAGFAPVASVKGFFGAYTGGTQAQLFQSTSATQRSYFNGGGLTISSAMPNSGVGGFAGNVAYLNGSAEAGSIGAGTASGFNVFIGARNVAGGVNANAQINCAAFVVYNFTLSAAQVLAVTNAMNAL